MSPAATASISEAQPMDSVTWPTSRPRYGSDVPPAVVVRGRRPVLSSCVELIKFQVPATPAELNAPVTTLCIRRIMFAVDDIQDGRARLQAHGAKLVGEV